MDDLHVDPGLRFAQLGLPMLLEKPIGPTWGRMRPTPGRAAGGCSTHYRRPRAAVTRPTPGVLRSLIAEGAVGEIVNIHHLEPVGFWHFAHSFARGNWRSTAAAAPFMVSKACHDVDWVMHLIGAECVAVSSFGALNHFRRELRPAGAADRCVDCQVDCVYDARSIYLDMARRGDFSHPVSTITDDATVAAVEHAPGAHPIRAVRLRLRQRRGRHTSGVAALQRRPDRLDHGDGVHRVAGPSQP